MLHAAIDRVTRGLSATAIGLVLACTAADSVQARGPLQQETLASIDLADLPSQARTTYRLILKGGPFPYDKDGSIFGNRERLLPPQKRGYYREYTVKTPWARDRGARRIVCGGQLPTAPQACYYTSDHYNSFRKITP
ncbi:MAG: ribonuclease domain-containing protein [Comamonas sp.]